jgi:hypothetical protein
MPELFETGARQGGVALGEESVEIESGWRSLQSSSKQACAKVVSTLMEIWVAEQKVCLALGLNTIQL